MLAPLPTARDRGNGREREGPSRGFDCAEVVPNVSEAKVQFLSVKSGNQLKVFHRLRWSPSGDKVAR
jgi:hypothetical protein